MLERLPKKLLIELAQQSDVLVSDKNSYKITNTSLILNNTNAFMTTKRQG
jgi:hypothetical protein